MLYTNDYIYVLMNAILLGIVNLKKFEFKNIDLKKFELSYKDYKIETIQKIERKFDVKLPFRLGSIIVGML